MHYPIRTITVTHGQIPFDLNRWMDECPDPHLRAACKDEMTNLAITEIHLVGGSLEQLCIHARYRGADCKLKVDYRDAGEYESWLSVDNSTPAALKPTYEQALRLMPFIVSLAARVFDHHQEASVGEHHDP
jgi:hypothetical protein